jgi:hypothetical protein
MGNHPDKKDKTTMKYLKTDSVFDVKGYHDLNGKIQRLFSVDSPKAIKSIEFGYLNAIHYLAPHKLALAGNVCSHATPPCIDNCLGWQSGQASMVKHESDLNAVRKSRIVKTRLFTYDRKAYLNQLAREITKLVAVAISKGLTLCVRLNGASDILWEGVRHESGLTLFDMFPAVQFVDYTKNPNRFKKALPANLHLTFSALPGNHHIARELLAQGHNVAVIFGDGLPKTWHGFVVIDGDQHDLRHLDVADQIAAYGDTSRGVVVGLSPKGSKAKRDRDSGFVVWSDQLAA